MTRRTVMAAMALLALLAAAPAQARVSGEGYGDGLDESDRIAAARVAQPYRGQLQGTLTVGRGSDTTYNVSALLASLYNFSPMREVGNTSENRAGDVILNAPPEGSSVGIAQLADYVGLDEDADVPDARTAFARSSRGPRDTDPEGLRFTRFARDAIVPVTFGGLTGPSAGVESLTRRQLRGIFVTCRITNFNQIGGADAPIEVYAIQEGSGTRATFDQFVGGDSSTCITDPDNIIFENNPNPILEADTGVEPDERGRALFYFSFARLSTSVPNENVRAVGVDGVLATAATISDRSFPFVRDVYFVTAKNDNLVDRRANRAADRFVDWVCKPNREHTEDLITGLNYGELIDDTIVQSGFGVVSCKDTDT